jgi:hypothetical protein
MIKRNIDVAKKILSVKPNFARNIQDPHVICIRINVQFMAMEVKLSVQTPYQQEADQERPETQYYSLSDSHDIVWKAFKKLV